MMQRTGADRFIAEVTDAAVAAEEFVSGAATIFMLTMTL
jgi:hypothetical protein